MYMKKKFISDLAFYITNRCGLACEGCVSFNNYVLKGDYEWNTAKDKINAWSDKIDVGNITIMGGEPFLHKDLENWVKGIRQAFPRCKDIRVVTGLTGARLIRHMNMVRMCIDNDVAVQISVHDPAWWSVSQDTAEQLLEGIDYMKEETVDEGSFPLKVVNYYGPKGTLIFTMMELWSFFPSAKKEIKDGVMYLHDNDPELAHKLCYCRSSQYIVDGDMFKCAVSAVADAMVTQLPLDERSKNLLGEVKGISPYEENELDFSTAIPQCSLCSVNMEKLIPIKNVDGKKPRL